MEFLQLFPVLLVGGFALASLTYYRHSKETHWLYWGIAFSVYCIALILELALGFAFNDKVLRIWYWLRHILLVALFGLSLLCFIYKDHPRCRYVEWGVWIVALVGLLLISLTAITQAVDWFDPSQTIYIQYVDLLARNRPTRWLTYLMNAFGFGVAFWHLRLTTVKKQDFLEKIFPFRSVAFGLLIILLQSFFIQKGFLWAMWLIPMLGSTSIFIGMRLFTWVPPLEEEENRSGLWWLPRWHHIVIALLIVGGLQLRMSSYGDPALSVTNYDSGEFIRAAERDLFSVEFFTSNRPATIVLFYKILEPASGYELTNLSSPAENIRFGKTLQPGLDRVVIGQMWLAIISWSMLALALARRIRNPILKIVAVLFTLTFAYSPNLVEWDSVLLSESLALSLFALMLAATLEAAPHLLVDKRPVKIISLAIFVLWAVVMVLWVFSRDTNAYMLLLMIMAAVLLIILPASRRKLDFRWMFVIILFLSSLFVFQNRTLAASDRWVNPFFNNMLVNIFPYPERLAFFEEQGMPLTDEVLSLRDAVVNQDGFWEIPYLMDWVYTRGYSAYSRYLITHPVYTLQTVVDSFDVVFSENVQPFFSPDYDITPAWMYYVGNMLHPLSASSMLIVLLLTGALVWKAFFGLHEAQMTTAGVFAVLLLGLFAMLAVSVLGDGISTIRHAMVAVVPFRLLMWLLAIVGMDKLLLPNAVSAMD